MTFTFKSDLGRVKVNQHAKHLTNFLSFLDKVLHGVNEGYSVDVVFLT